MISDKHKDATFSSPLNHYQYACRKALPAIPGIRKAFINFLIETLMLFVLLPRKANFTQMGIYGNYCEKTFRKNFSKHFEWIDFNIELSKHLLSCRVSVRTLRESSAKPNLLEFCRGSACPKGLEHR